MILPNEAQPLLEALSPVFTASTFARFVTLLGSAILCTGRRTVANLLRTAAPLNQGHRFSWANRPWAPPVLVDLYRCEEDDRERGRPHRTPARIMTTLPQAMLLWFPDRRFVFVGDSGFGTHEMARFVHRHRARLSLVSKLYPEANLFEPPPPYSGMGRPPVKGPRRPKPRQAVAGATLKTEEVAWYGGGRREVGVITGTGHWDKAGQGLVPIAWVYVKDQTGTHRDESFFSTDTTMTAVAMIEADASRWNGETTFQEVRCFLGLETTRGRCRQTVLRAATCLFWLDTVVALLDGELPESKRGGRVEWQGKVGVTFSDTLACVRRRPWREWVFPQTGGSVAANQLPESLRKVLFHTLAPAARDSAFRISRAKS